MVLYYIEQLPKVWNLTQGTHVAKTEQTCLLC